MKKLFVILVILGAALALASPVQAHAILVRSAPDANAVLARAPAQVELFFSESVDPNFSMIKVLDTNGKQVDANDARVDTANGMHMTISLGSLSDGVYTVEYAVVSASDGHATSGAFPFAVGNVGTETFTGVQSASSSSSLSPVEVLAKGWLYLAAAALVGGILFTTLVWNPALRLDKPGPMEITGFQELSDKLVWAGLVSLLLADILHVMVQAGQASGTAMALPWQPTFNTLLFNTRLGVLAIARFGLAFALMGLLLAPANPWNRWAAFLAGLVLLLTFSLESHAAAEAHPWLPVLADWAHMTAVAVWVGGLFYFLAGMQVVGRLDPPGRTELTSVLIPSFSNLALSSVGVLTLTGVYSAVLRLGSLLALFNTLYGEVLVVKLGLAAVMVGFGAFNLLVTTPALRRAAAQPGGSPAWAARFRWLLFAETVVGSLLLVWVGLFTSLPPAQAISTPAGFIGTVHVDDLAITLNIDPARVGENTFTATVSSGGKRVGDAQRVTLEFASISGKLPTTSANLTSQGNGVYSLIGGYLGVADQWYIQVVVVRQGKFDAYGSYRLTLGSGAAGPFPWKTAAVILLFATAVSYTLAFHAIDNRILRWGPVGFAPALTLVLAGVLILARPAAPSQADPINPIAPDAASIAAGKTLFQQNCAACHGETGKGDGPVGLTLNPHPADLSVHAVPGVHTDGQLYNWITNGFPNSAMAAFKEKLSGSERWNLVNFIRTLAPR